MVVIFFKVLLGSDSGKLKITKKTTDITASTPIKAWIRHLHSAPPLFQPSAFYDKKTHTSEQGYDRQSRSQNIRDILQTISDKTFSLCKDTYILLLNCAKLPVVYPQLTYTFKENDTSKGK
jgi:hypothetical protein